MTTPKDTYEACKAFKTMQVSICLRSGSDATAVGKDLQSALSDYAYEDYELKVEVKP